MESLKNIVNRAWTKCIFQELAGSKPNVLHFSHFHLQKRQIVPQTAKIPPPPYEIPERSVPDSDFFFQNMMIMMTAMDLPRDMHSHIFVHSHILYIVTAHQLNPHTARAFIHTLQKVLAPTYCSLDNCKIGTVQMNKLKCQFWVKALMTLLHERMTNVF